MNESDVTALIVFVMTGTIVLAVFAYGYYYVPGF